MDSASASGNGGTTDLSRLFLSLAEQLKTPFIQISGLALEYSMEPASQQPQKGEISAIAQRSLLLIDSFLLSNQLAQDQLRFELEPVSLSAVLEEAAHQLTPSAHQYGCQLELSLSGRYGPVMANRRVVKAAISSLLLGLMESSQSASGSNILQLGAYRTAQGMRAGVFGPFEGLGASTLESARSLHGISKQPFPMLHASSASGIFIADRLFQGISSQLQAARHNKMSGFAATLLPSRQLTLI